MLEDLFPVKHNPLFSAVFVSNLDTPPAEHSNSFCARNPSYPLGISVDENARHKVEERHSLLDKALETGRLRVSGQGDVGPSFSSGITLEDPAFGQDRAATCLSASSRIHTDDDGDASLHGSVWATSHSVLGQAPGTHLGCMLHGTLSATDSHELNIASLHGILDASIPRLPALSIETQVSRMPPTGTLSCEVGPCGYRNTTVRYDVSTSPVRCIDTQKLSWTCKAAHGRKHAAVYTRDHMSPDDSSEGALSDSRLHICRTTLWKLHTCSKKTVPCSIDKEESRTKEQGLHNRSWHMPQIDMEWHQGSCRPHTISCVQPILQKYRIKASRDSRRGTTSLSLGKDVDATRNNYKVEWTCQSLASMSASRSYGNDESRHTYRVSWKPTQRTVTLSLSYKTKKKKKSHNHQHWVLRSARVSTKIGTRGSIFHQLNLSCYFVF
ncbi:hypothetical protein M9434_004572 [Picochlorum sp. BPE23]|nr:hypothetical protein M9434_004572 [Picochlorum sp. BPE23]